MAWIGGEARDPRDPHDVSVTVLREHISQLACPWCPGRTFRNLGTHMHLRHGISPRDLKFAALIPLEVPLVSADVSEMLRSKWEEGKGVHIERLRSMAHQAADVSARTDTPLRQLRRQQPPPDGKPSICDACGRRRTAAPQDCSDQSHVSRYETKQEIAKRRRRRLQARSLDRFPSGE